MRVLMLMGVYAGQVIQIADLYGAQGVADGWCRDTAGLAYPYNSSGMILNRPTGQLPASYLAWAQEGYPGSDWLAPADPDRYMFFATRNRMPSGAIYTALAGSNYILSKRVFCTPPYKTNRLKFHYSGFACTEGGSSPQEIIVTGTVGTPGNPVNVDFVDVRVNGVFSRAKFASADGAVIADQTNGAWIDELVLPVDIPSESEVEVWTCYHTAVGEKQYPVYRAQKHRGERDWGGPDLATVSAFKNTPLAPSTPALDANYGAQAQFQAYGPDFMLAKGKWDGRPVVLVVDDSLGHSRQEYSAAADARGNLGWLSKWLDSPQGIGRLPHQHIGVPGSASARELNGSGATIATRRWAILDEIIAFNNNKSPYTVLWNQLGQNDTNSVYATWFANYLGLPTRLRARYAGVKIVASPPFGRTTSSNLWKDEAGQTYSPQNVFPAVPGDNTTGKWLLRNDILAKTNGCCDAAIDTLAAWQGPGGVAKWPGGVDLPSTTVAVQAGTDGVATYTTIEVVNASIFNIEQPLLIYSQNGATLIRQPTILGINGNVLTVASAATVVPAGSLVYQQVTPEGVHPFSAMVKRVAGNLDPSEKMKF